MTRTLPWLKVDARGHAPNDDLDVRPIKKQRVLSEVEVEIKRQDEAAEPGPSRRELASGIRTPHASNGDDAGVNVPELPLTKKLRATDLRSPSASPPPGPPQTELMVAGLDADDIYRLVEDELLETAQLFTAHSHYAAYVREKELARARPTSSIARPTVASHTAISRGASSWKIPRYQGESQKNRNKKAKVTSKLDSKLSGAKSRFIGGTAKDQIQQEGGIFEGTPLQELVRLSAMPVIPLIGVQGAQPRTRAAAGYSSVMQDEDSENTAPGTTGNQLDALAMPRSQGLASKPYYFQDAGQTEAMHPAQDPSADETNGSSDDDLDRPSHVASSKSGGASTSILRLRPSASNSEGSFHTRPAAAQDSASRSQYLAPSTVAQVATTHTPPNLNPRLREHAARPASRAKVSSAQSQIMRAFGLEDDSPVVSRDLVQSASVSRGQAGLVNVEGESTSCTRRQEPWARNEKQEHKDNRATRSRMHEIPTFLH